MSSRKTDRDQPAPVTDRTLPTPNTWHPGERMMQKLAGSADRLEDAASRIFRTDLNERAREFFAGLPFLVLGVVDAEGHPWGTLLAGEPGFVWSPDRSLLRVDCAPTTGVPMLHSLCADLSVGLLGIDLSARRRVRVNGVISDCAASGFTVRVQQCFGNCSQYIQQRVLFGPRECAMTREAQPFVDLDAEARCILASCDTFFVATFSFGSYGIPAVDVSHRGGRSGFVHVDASGTLTIPDFPGNGYFNTLGNIVATGRAGIAVPVFDTGDLLLLSGNARVGVTTEEQHQAVSIQGAVRLWHLSPQQGWMLRGAVPDAFQFQGWSPQTLAKGFWPWA